MRFHRLAQLRQYFCEIWRTKDRAGIDTVQTCIPITERRSGINVGAVCVDCVVELNKSEPNLADACAFIASCFHVNSNEPDGAWFWCGEFWMLLVWYVVFLVHAEL